MVFLTLPSLHLSFLELVIEFDKPSYTVLEESDEVALLLRSNIPLQDSGVSILISTEDGTAMGIHDKV